MRLRCSITITILLLLCPFCCNHTPQTDTARVDEKAPTKPDERWDEVLEMAKSKSPRAREKLSEIAEGSKQIPSSILASRILSLWDEKGNTFYSEDPLLVLQGIKDMQLFEGELLIRFKVDVDSRGLVTSANILSKLNDEEKKAKLLTAIRETLYCPAKPQDVYLPASRNYLINIEIE